MRFNGVEIGTLIGAIGQSVSTAISCLEMKKISWESNKVIIIIDKPLNEDDRNNIRNGVSKAKVGGLDIKVKKVSVSITKKEKTKVVVTLK